MLRRASLVALASFALLVPVNASTVEELTVGAVAYQYDGGTYHDAPDGCDGADAAWSLPPGSSVDGLLAPPDDVRDAYVVDVPRSLVGERLQLAIDDPSDAQGLAIDAFVPGCMGSILDAVNWPHPEPVPPAPTAGERQASPALEPRYCNPERWVFVLDQMEGFTPPASIHAAWTDATERPLPLRWSNERYAVYLATDPLVALKGAWANVPAAWPGDFTLFLGPCGAPDGGAVYGDAPTVGLGSIAFTPVRAGPHVVVVSWQGGALPAIDPPASVDPTVALPVEPHEAMHDPEGAADALAAYASDPPSPQELVPSISVPASCHFCLGPVSELVQDGIQPASYRLAARMG